MEVDSCSSLAHFPMMELSMPLWSCACTSHWCLLAASRSSRSSLTRSAARWASWAAPPAFAMPSIAMRLMSSTSMENVVDVRSALAAYSFIVEVVLVSTAAIRDCSISVLVTVSVRQLRAPLPAASSSSTRGRCPSNCASSSPSLCSTPPYFCARSPHASCVTLLAVLSAMLFAMLPATVPAACSTAPRSLMTAFATWPCAASGTSSLPTMLVLRSRCWSRCCRSRLWLWPDASRALLSASQTSATTSARICFSCSSWFSRKPAKNMRWRSSCAWIASQKPRQNFSRASPSSICRRAMQRSTSSWLRRSALASSARLRAAASRSARSSRPLSHVNSGTLCMHAISIVDGILPGPLPPATSGA
mmetsp:Transcript_66176/g.186347  ORF Transcript_66176/g.186347 Transcript_66176/m.186347 type:complete len:362 (+) Transcript_66176:403-1488(+)